MFGCRLAIRQLSRLRTVAAVPLQISNAQTTSLIYPTPCTQCRNKHSIKRPMKPAPEPINELYENPDLVSHINTLLIQGLNHCDRLSTNFLLNLCAC